MFAPPLNIRCTRRVEKQSRPGHGDEPELTCTKIYYASRTHSQLTQVLPELQRLKLYSNVISLHPSDKTKKRQLDESESNSEVGLNTRTVALGSRKQLCINDEVREKTRDLDEGCRELLGGAHTFILHPQEFAHL